MASFDLNTVRVESAGGPKFNRGQRDTALGFSHWPASRDYHLLLKAFSHL